MSRDEKASIGVALVTGAGRRVGRAIALGLAEAGYDIAVHYNTSDQEAREVASLIEAQGRRAIMLSYDLIEAEGSGVLIEQAVESFGQVDVLVNSASLFDEDNLQNLTLESWTRILNVNLTAPVFLMQAFERLQPRLAEGAIINILDTEMSSVYPERLSYFCGKFGLEGATKVAAFDLASKGITVNALAPGMVLPSGQTDEEFARLRKLTPRADSLGVHDIIQAVLYLISARQVTGHTLVVDGGQKLMGMGNMNP